MTPIHYVKPSYGSTSNTTICLVSFVTPSQTTVSNSSLSFQECEGPHDQRTPLAQTPVLNWTVTHDTGYTHPSMHARHGTPLGHRTTDLRSHVTLPVPVLGRDTARVPTSSKDKGNSGNIFNADGFPLRMMDSRDPPRPVSPKSRQRDSSRLRMMMMRSSFKEFEES